MYGNNLYNAFFSLIGKMLRDSGWTTVLSQAQVLTFGRAQSVLNENHIKHTYYAHPSLDCLAHVFSPS